MALRRSSRSDAEQQHTYPEPLDNSGNGMSQLLHCERLALQRDGETENAPCGLLSLSSPDVAPDFRVAPFFSVMGFSNTDGDTGRNTY